MLHSPFVNPHQPEITPTDSILCALAAATHTTSGTGSATKFNPGPSSYGRKVRRKEMEGRSRNAVVIIVIATILGLLLGLGIGTTKDPNWLGAIIVGVISAAGAWLATTGYQTLGLGKTGPTTVQDPALARFLFSDTRAAALWLPVRIFFGWSFLDASLHKLGDPKWMDTGVALKGYWAGAVAIPAAPARPAITYDWWRQFLQWMLDNEAYTWFAKVIAVGEFLVGIGVIVGGLVGIAALFGATMNVAFLLSGSASTNPVLLLSAIFLVMAWKVAGWVGADRFLLPLLGTPWQRHPVTAEVSPQPAPTS
jgi:thiosulfate dehydrogenase [quinone] large subunit